LLAHGVRAQLRSGNLLTGALYVAFDFFPDAPPATVDWSQKPVELPTIPGELEAIEASVVRIIKKIEELPFKALGNDLLKAMSELDRTLVSARGTLDSGRDALDNANKLIEPNSVLGAELGNTLQEVSRAARSVRVLADYLERHPEALIRGKTGEAK
jgi:paraquat-inducible protein B